MKYLANHRRHCLNYIALVGAVSSLLFGGSAIAQSTDYSSLEALFGESVTASATGSPQRISDAPVSMDIITSDDIRRSGKTNIPDIIRNLAGIDVQRSGVASVDVGIRGYNQPGSPRLLVLINGRQVYLDYYNFTDWSTLPVELSEIRQIEVVKGPNSALFGFNAVAGVINIITFNPLYDDVTSLTVRGGTQSYRELSGVGTVKIADGAAVRLSAGGYNSQDYGTPVPFAEQSSIIHPQRRSASVDSWFQVTENSQFNFEATRSEVRQSEFSNAFSLSNDRFTTSSLKGGYIIDSWLGLITATGYHNWAQALLDDTSQPVYNVQTGLTVFKVEDLIKAGADNVFRPSFEYRRDESNTFPILGGTVGYTVLSGGLMWNWQALSQVTLTTAARIDHLSLYRSGPLDSFIPLTNADWNKRRITRPSFNAGLVWKATEDDTVRLTFAQGVQAPSLAEVALQKSAAGAFGFSSVPRYQRIGNQLVQVGTTQVLDTSATVNSTGISGNPRINPSIVTNYELAYDRPIEPLDAVFRGSVFYQHTRDIKSLTAGLEGVAFPGAPGQPDTIVTLTENVGSSSLAGFELDLKHKRVENWNWDLNYSVINIVDKLNVNNTGAGFTDPIDYKDTTPTHRVNYTIGYSVDDWEFNLFTQWQSAILLPRARYAADGSESYFLERIHNFFSESARVGYKIDDSLSLALSGSDLIQARQHQIGAREVERRAYLTFTANF